MFFQRTTDNIGKFAVRRKFVKQGEASENREGVFSYVERFESKLQQRIAQFIQPRKK